MRLASGGIQHETNTFSTTPTTLADFIRNSQLGPQIEGGDTIIERYAVTDSIHDSSYWSVYFSKKDFLIIN